MKFDPVEFENLRLAGEAARRIRTCDRALQYVHFRPRETTFDDYLMMGLAATPFFCALFI